MSWARSAPHAAVHQRRSQRDLLPCIDDSHQRHLWAQPVMAWLKTRSASGCWGEVLEITCSSQIAGRTGCAYRELNPTVLMMKSAETRCLETGALGSMPSSGAPRLPAHDPSHEIGNSAIDARRADFDAAGCTIERVADEAELCRRTAAAIAEGKVVGWFQGRMEWGPRALGNRSIVCDPRRADMKDILNRKIKRRESFRPFAPSILREAVADWFETDDDVPFMMQVFQIREEKRALIPAVTHVDGSGRLQTVTPGAATRATTG